MLTNKDLHKLNKEIIDMVREIEMELPLDIVRIFKLNKTIKGSERLHLDQLDKLVLLPEDSLSIISELSGKTIAEVAKMFDQVVVEVAKLTGDEEYIQNIRDLRDKRLKHLNNATKANDLEGDHSRAWIAKNYGEDNDNTLPFTDVTQQWMAAIDHNKIGEVVENDYFTYDGKILKHGIDGVKLSMDLDGTEIGIANWLKETFHEDVQLIPRPIINGQGIKSSDYIFKNENWDLKGINGCAPDTIRNRIRKGQGQANNFIIDISKSNLSIEDSIIQSKRLFSQKNTYFVESVILIKDQELITIFTRKK